MGLIPGLGRSPDEGNDNPLQYACLEKSHGQRNLVGYSPWDLKELDKTEQLNKFQVYSKKYLNIFNNYIIYLIFARNFKIKDRIVLEFRLGESSVNSVFPDFSWKTAYNLGKCLVESIWLLTRLQEN